MALPPPGRHRRGQICKNRGIARTFLCERQRRQWSRAAFRPPVGPGRSPCVCQGGKSPGSSCVSSFPADKNLRSVEVHKI